MSDISVDAVDVAAAIKQRAAQTYADMLDENARLSCYAAALAARVAELEARLARVAPDAWDEPAPN